MIFSIFEDYASKVSYMEKHVSFTKDYAMLWSNSWEKLLMCGFQIDLILPSDND